MKRRSIFYLGLSILLGTNLSAQYKLDIKGAVRIQGNMEISASETNSTSVHIGREAGELSSNSSSMANTYLGFKAGRDNELGAFNTAIGAYAGTNNTGSFNCFVGSEAGFMNTTGAFNTFFGHQAGYANNGDRNIFIGTGAGWNNRTGYNNLYIGDGAGYGKVSEFPSGFNNIALGTASSRQTVSGNNNISIGDQSLYENDHGFQNIAIGQQALYFNYNNYNTAVGTQALYNTNTGSQNTALGGFAGFANNNASSTFIGYDAGSTVGVTNGTAIGYAAKVNDNNKVRIGNGSVTVIEGNVAFSPMSDRRLKENIKPVPLGLNFILDLTPVVYHRISNEKEDLEMGLIAQELDSVLHQHQGENITMVNRGGDGHLSVRYNDLFAPFIRAIQEQQKTIEALRQKTDKQESLIQFLLEEKNRGTHNSTLKLDHQKQ